ncbi:unnamed protein product [Penicillium nalgiovense]|uniref:Uncharacterized protein n=1 Tax=Penicillium nalgiovense TaxID=60175 RepID=A0A1V6YFP5_PENNA|nr:hypothetical protein PENNAL_c0021G01774 [Penicillium nalgiovense]CAG7939313.1 unnamed protein product [Penicillium nalgiovense]CAG7943662.1 unnamed protein product [Penicillium nalgiovense]CAG7952728.1 unnamed protein product [Penicillium nalgiovense]CAG7956682.1 unnamed protein product [Penicillium nalgiovense]
MIRRPPTIIALDENDVEYHLQRIYIRHTLTVGFEQLHLESCDETGPFSSSCISTDSDVDIDTADLSQAGSCFEPTSPKDSYSSKDSIAHNSVTKSCLKSPIPNQQSSLPVATSTGVNSQADQSVDSPRLKVKFALSPQVLGLHSKAPLEEETDRGCRGENHRPSHTDAIYTPMCIDSPASTPQVSFLSCGVSSSPATASVPSRDLTLASTMSYEAVLAEGAVSAANSIGEDHGSHT